MKERRKERTFDGALLLLERHEDPDPLRVRRVPSLGEVEVDDRRGPDGG